MISQESMVIDLPETKVHGWRYTYIYSGRLKMQGVTLILGSTLDSEDLPTDGQDISSIRMMKKLIDGEVIFADIKYQLVRLIEYLKA